MLPPTDKPEFSRAKARSESEDPILTQAKILRLDPILLVLRTDSEEAILVA
jgi:hypothetical protein